jgi:ADP-ribosylglycohydrolase
MVAMGGGTPAFMSTPIARALRSLEGLSTGDAFGELHFVHFRELTSLRTLPDAPWPWTDDTHMALSIVEVLATHQHIDQDALAAAFVRRFGEDPLRGYGAGAFELLHRLGSGADWREESPALFGDGSYGNGAAMRVAPLGAYFADDLDRAAAEALQSAAVTHAHPEGQAGAMAVAVAAALAAQPSGPDGAAFIASVMRFVPPGDVHDGLQSALEIPIDRGDEAVWRLGTGARISAQDTVPFCIWVAAHHLHDYEAALRTTAWGRGDVDTTCAIVGGIVAMSATEIPASWVERREAFSWQPTPGT